MSVLSAPATVKASVILSPKLVLGDVGTGKSAFSTAYGIKQLQNGRDVYANYDLSEKFKQEHPDLYAHWHYVESLPMLFRDRLRQASIADFAPYRDLLIIDEAWNTFESRESMSAYNILMSALIFLHRKLGFELIYVAQLQSSLDTRARALWQQVILAERREESDGSLYFVYHAWRKNPITDALIPMGKVTMPNATFEQIKDFYHSTRPTSSEYENTLADLNALINGDSETREDNKCGVAIVTFLQANPGKRFDRYELSRAEEMKGFRVSEIARALTGLLDSGKIQVGEIRNRLRTYYAPEE